MSLELPLLVLALGFFPHRTPCGGLRLPRLRDNLVMLIRHGRAAAEVSREPCWAAGCRGIVRFVAVVRRSLWLFLGAGVVCPAPVLLVVGALSSLGFGATWVLVFY